MALFRTDFICLHILQWELCQKFLCLCFLQTMKLATLFHSHNLEGIQSWPTTHSDLSLAAAMQFQWCLRYCSAHICESQICFDPLQLARFHFVHIVVWLLQLQLHLLEWNVCLSLVRATSLNFILGTFYTLFELTVGFAKGTDSHLIYDLLPFIALNQPILAFIICARHTSDYLVHYFQRSPPRTFSRFGARRMSIDSSNFEVWYFQSFGTASRWARAWLFFNVLNPTDWTNTLQCLMLPTYFQFSFRSLTCYIAVLMLVSGFLWFHTQYSTLALRQ